MLDELARELAVELVPLAGDREALLAKLDDASGEDWPTPVAGYWVAAARRAGASWDAVASHLSLPPPSVVARFSPWEARFGHEAVPPAGNLPLPRTSFVGREGERAEVARLIGGSRIVTLRGPGGIGKSRLALQVVATMRPAPPGGAWWVDLAPLKSGDQVPEQVACTLAVPEQGGRSLLDGLCSVLRSPARTLV
ncbi:MAG: hypothetical protein ACRDLV_17045, partial [Solirubrobacteraceae bacterium]